MLKKQRYLHINAPEAQITIGGQLCLTGVWGSM